ncbi:MAG: hypothetical protein IJW46_01530, partial [Clostridia bacterium]|nr:hypothetical protein [Clostridia bacterium]
MPNGENKSGAPLSLQELLALLKSEHGEDALTPNKKKTDPSDVSDEDSIDDFEFDDSPIEADYLNYNRIGVGITTTPVKKNMSDDAKEELDEKTPEDPTAVTDGAVDVMDEDAEDGDPVVNDTKDGDAEEGDEDVPLVKDETSDVTVT